MIKTEKWRDVGNFRRCINTSDCKDFITGVGASNGKIRPASFEALKKNWQVRDWLIRFRAKVGEGL